MHLVETLKIQVGSIHDVNCTGFENQMIEHIDVVNLSIGDPDESWNIATKIQQRVKFDRRFGFSKARPWKG